MDTDTARKCLQVLPAGSEQDNFWKAVKNYGERFSPSVDSSHI